MRKTNCLTVDALKVGMRYEKQLSFSREQVATYCALCGDHNAIHREHEAACLRFPEATDIIVPGGLIQISVTGIFGSEFPGDGCMGLTFTPERFRKPVFPGDEIHVAIEIVKMRGPMLEVDVTINDSEGETLTVAKSRLIAADDAYYAWWKSKHS